MSSASGEEGSAGGGGGLGLSLSRWTSARSYGAHGKEWFGSPLARTESTQSYKGDMRGRSTAKPKPATSSSKPKPTSAAAPQAPLKSRRKGTRMLNGRVYGGRRIDGQNTNLFVTAKDEEPEFVEWGYGGMGSVKAGKQHGGTQWSRLQSDSGVGGGGVDDDDDGGGMGWVRKRKEARERERREREEKEARDRLEAETEPVAPPAIDNQPSDPPPPPSSSVAEQQDQSSPIAPSSGIDEVLRSPLTTAPDQAQPPDDNCPPADADEKQFVTCAVNVPAPHHHHHSHRTASYTGLNPSQGNSSANLSGLEADKEMVSSPLRMASFEGVIEMAMQGMGEKLEGDNTSESGGDDGDESEGGDDQDDDEPEDENEAEVN